MKRPWLDRAIRPLSVTAAFAVVIATALPWYYLPVMGWEVPAPPWNRTGLALLVLGSSLALRGVAGSWVRWLVRPLLLVAATMWWHDPAEIRNWGIKSLGPLQIKLSALNVALDQFGVDGVEFFKIQAWKTLEPGWGWYSAGVILLVTGAITALDRGPNYQCPDCRVMVGGQDYFCHGCGKGLTEANLCLGCAQPVNEKDVHCRKCGRKRETL